MDDPPPATYRDRGFWSEENQKYRFPHFRLQKAGRMINHLVGRRDVTLLDVGCGPSTLRTVLGPTIRYFGIDIAIPEPGPDLLEMDILNQPIDFGGQRFDLVVAQGLFEYMGDHQSQKLTEIAGLLEADGTFLASYVNFAHRKAQIYDMYNNVQPLARFEQDLSRFFTVRRRVPTSHNWNHSEPSRRPLQAMNMRFNATIPYVSPKLVVQYLFVCSARLPDRHIA